MHLSTLEQILKAGPATVRIGSATDSIGAFRWIAAARLSPDGSRIAVLDSDPPFLRVFAADGRPLAALVQQGHGPTEATNPAALGLSAGEAVLADPGALVHVNLETGVVRRLPPVGVRVQGIDVGCAGGWLAYGPSRSEPRRYIHALTIDTVAALMHSSLVDTTAVRRAWGGISPHVVAGTTGAVIEHRTQAHDQIVAVDCRGEPRQVPWAWSLAELPALTMHEEERVAQSGSEMAITVDAAVPFATGRVVIDDELVWFESRMATLRKPPRSLADMEQRTYVYLVGEKGMHAGYIAGQYLLQDFRAGRLLLSTEGEYPVVLVVPWQTFRRALADAEWRARD